MNDIFSIRLIVTTYYAKIKPKVFLNYLKVKLLRLNSSIFSLNGRSVFLECNFVLRRKETVFYLTFERILMVVLKAYFSPYYCQIKNFFYICTPLFGVWPSPVKAPALGAGDRRFESCHPDIQALVNTRAYFLHNTKDRFKQGFPK